MKQMKIKLLVLTIAVAVCMIASPAKANTIVDLFGFHLGNLSVSYDGGSALTTTSLAGITSGSLYRTLTPAGTAQFAAPLWGTGAESLLISMTLSNIGPTTADGTGTITFSDVHGDTIAGNLSGAWNFNTGLPIFYGSLTTVSYTLAAATFDGHTGSVSLVYPSNPQPWNGAIVQLVATTNWFRPGIPLTVISGSLDASVASVPIPEPAPLFLLGSGLLGLAGYGRKRFFKK